VFSDRKYNGGRETKWACVVQAVDINGRIVRTTVPLISIYIVLSSCLLPLHRTLQIIDGAIHKRASPVKNNASVFFKGLLYPLI